jgi:hypothetical protein
MVMVLVVSVEVCYENGSKEERTDDKEVGVVQQSQQREQGMSKGARHNTNTNANGSLSGFWKP